MTKPRKKYKPKHVNPVSWKVAVMGQCRLSGFDQENFAAPAKLAVENAAKGCASKADWQAIFDVINMIDTFSTMPKVMQDATDYARSIQNVIERLLTRQKETKSTSLYSHELADLRVLIDLWCEVLTVVTMAEYLQCQEKTHTRIVQALRCKTGAIVVEAP
jgi:hypothetical protein